MNKVEEYRRRAADAEEAAETAPTDYDRRHFLQLTICYRVLAGDLPSAVEFRQHRG
jgi:hypothetical protein